LTDSVIGAPSPVIALSVTARRRRQGARRPQYGRTDEKGGAVPRARDLRRRPPAAVAAAAAANCPRDVAPPDLQLVDDRSSRRPDVI